MHVSTSKIGKVKRLARSSKVAITVHVPFQATIDRCQHCEGADVELALRYQKGLLDVLLNDSCTITVRLGNRVDD